MRLTRRALVQTLAAMLAARPALGGPAPRPFLRLAVAGTAYHRYAEVAGLLREGDRLLLRREPLNPHDPNAVEVVTAGGAKLGYVPRRAARDLAPRLDRGERIEAAITGFLPVPEPGQRFAVPEDLVRTWCEPGEPIVTLLS